MTDWSLEQVSGVRQALRTIVADPARGTAALSNVRVMSDLLPGLLPGARLERSALVTAVGAGVADMLRQHVREDMDAISAIRLTAGYLAAVAPLAIEACYRVVGEIAVALDLITTEQADILGSGGRPAARPCFDPEPNSDPWPYTDAAPYSDAERYSDWEARATPVAPSFQVSPTAAEAPAQPPQPQPQQPQPPTDMPASGPDDPISRAVREVVRPGLLAFNPPPEMVQGRPERVEVGVARTPELRQALTEGLRGRGVAQVLPVGTAPQMGVELRGSAFDIEAFSPPEQLVAPLARWEFNVTPTRAGRQALTLCVRLHINSPVVPGAMIAVPVLERQIRIRVDVNYGTRRFIGANWQWLVATALGLGGALAAWIALFR